MEWEIRKGKKNALFLYFLWVTWKSKKDNVFHLDGHTILVIQPCPNSKHNVLIRCLSTKASNGFVGPMFIIKPEANLCSLGLKRLTTHMVTAPLLLLRSQWPKEQGVLSKTNSNIFYFFIFALPVCFFLHLFFWFGTNFDV